MLPSPPLSVPDVRNYRIRFLMAEVRWRQRRITPSVTRWSRNARNCAFVPRQLCYPFTFRGQVRGVQCPVPCFSQTDLDHDAPFPPPGPGRASGGGSGWRRRRAGLAEHFSGAEVRQGWCKRTALPPRRSHRPRLRRRSPPAAAWGAVIAIKGNDYFLAARALGTPTSQILLHHMLPDIAAPVIIIFSINIGGVIISAAALSFLGFGLPPHIPDWGAMLSSAGRRYMEMAPRLALRPGLCLTIVVYCLNMFGDAMRDLLDPRLRGGEGSYAAATRKSSTTDYG